MRSLAENMAAYAAYHRHPYTKLTHFVGVPAIVFALLVLLALVRGTSDHRHECRRGARSLSRPP